MSNHEYRLVLSDGEVVYDFTVPAPQDLRSEAAFQNAERQFTTALWQIVKQAKRTDVPALDHSRLVTAHAKLLTVRKNVESGHSEFIFTQDRQRGAREERTKSIIKRHEESLEQFNALMWTRNRDIHLRKLVNKRDALPRWAFIRRSKLDTKIREIDPGWFRPNKLVS